MAFHFPQLKAISQKLKANKPNRGLPEMLRKTMPARMTRFSVSGRQAGMTYVELIVVLSIFSAMSSVILFNYNKFQDKVDIKNLANEIAIKVVEAQKSAFAGKLPPAGSYSSTWKPSYGVYFNLLSPGSNKAFIYFTDLNQSGDYTDLLFCPTPGTGEECLDKISITKGNIITELKVFYQDSMITPTTANDLSINFTRPNTGATIRSTTGFSSVVSYVELALSSQDGVTAKVRIYVSGRMEII